MKNRNITAMEYLKGAVDIQLVQLDAIMDLNRCLDYNLFRRTAAIDNLLGSTFTRPGGML